MTVTMAHSVTVCFARRQECLSTSMYCIVTRVALVCAPNVLSRIEWEDLLEVRLVLCNSIRCLNKRKKELKSLKNQNKMIYIIAKKSGSRREIKKVKAEFSKNNSISSSEDWYSNSSLASNSS